MDQQNQLAPGQKHLVLYRKMQFLEFREVTCLVEGRDCSHMVLLQGIIVRNVSSNRPKMRSRISNIEGLQRWPWASLLAQTLKNLPAMQETSVWSLDWKDPPEKKTATHSCILAWRIPWTEKPDRLQSMGLQRVGHNWLTFIQRWSLSITIKKGWRHSRAHHMLLVCCTLFEYHTVCI